jgi:hypothetical protein
LLGPIPQMPYRGRGLQAISALLIIVGLRLVVVALG